ncbi:hypothetical protein DFP72DRAFT_924134 [Ephemerocybe angulata]|uniref:Uncharacterized protein n=1 Tax=Ephemerocybe angulata TaxID=980116 RepID=A0A8H6HF55_9AGAR|nr:hypothetical protein DFP72DRAFT_924134 [Tulosesus angulatus]
MRVALLFFGVLAFVFQIYAAMIPAGGPGDLMRRQADSTCSTECTSVVQAEVACFSDATSKCGCDSGDAAPTAYKGCAECVLGLAAPVKTTAWLAATAQFFEGTYAAYATWCTAGFGLTVPPTVTVTPPTGSGTA